MIAAPPASDRLAILSMAGTYDVTFDFTENFAIAPDYEIKSKPYHEKALEVVIVAEDTPERIALQHLLVVSEGGRSHVIKHWSQIWTWQDTVLLDYAGSEGDDVWQRREVKPEEAKNRWSQLVTSVDDTPRYEALGAWVHHGGESTWTGEPTRRPLPRREYEKRDDYDYLIAINRHTITATGWVHTQDNRKVVDRAGHVQVLSAETGLNQYTRSENELASVATQWWEKNQTIWGDIRNFWVEAIQQSGQEFAYRTSVDGVGISKRFKELEINQPSREIVFTTLSPYLKK